MEALCYNSSYGSYRPCTLLGRTLVTMHNAFTSHEVGVDYYAVIVWEGGTGREVEKLEDITLLDGTEIIDEDGNLVVNLPIL